MDASYFAPLSSAALMEDQPMLHKCANASCSSSFRQLDRGKLFQVEIEQPLILAKMLPSRRKAFRQVERYWLCDVCATLFTLTWENGSAVTLAPLPLTCGRELSSQPSVAKFHEVRQTVTTLVAAR